MVSGCLEILCAVSWTLAYALALLRGARDKTYGIPLPAVMINIAWELLYSTVFKNDAPFSPSAAAIWLLLDTLILIQAVQYSRREFPNLRPVTVAALASAGVAVSFVALYAAQKHGLSYITSAFPQNLMMSILFLQMNYAREDARGQSMYIGASKMLGTAAAIYLAISAEIESVLALTFAGILLFDCLYLVVLHAQLRRLGINPWKRL